ncbi:CHAD domain-containing protein [Cecembia calidifontis]|uniref:CHAD domain-containing protein n=1 Tax=Cecembia calidifontis TaxID=1187080 RepID=A0A4Q7P5C2_9BACT|nr:CHAD domain-containing protein [Cecembia calidifontis]RZS95115.1 CHAD domain-containing protein [Cecembia calidifontis]
MATEPIYNNFLKEHLDQVSQHLSRFFESKGAEDIHQLRVNIKKIKALIQFFEHLEPDTNYKKLFQPIRKLFKQAGEIRELQLHLIRLESLPERDEKNEKKLIAKLEKSINRFLKNKEKWDKYLNRFQENTSQIDLNFEANTLTAYFNSTLLKTNNKLRKGEFHEARMKIKIILYLKSLFTEQQQHAIRINFEFLDQLQEKIGNWHDLLVSHKMSKEKNQEKVILQELETLEKELNATSNTFLQSVFTSTSPA